MTKQTKKDKEMIDQAIINHTVLERVHRKTRQNNYADTLYLSAVILLVTGILIMAFGTTFLHTMNGLLAYAGAIMFGTLSVLQRFMSK